MLYNIIDIIMLEDNWMTNREIRNEIEKLKSSKERTLRNWQKIIKQHKPDNCSIEIPNYLKSHKI